MVKLVQEVDLMAVCTQCGKAATEKEKNYCEGKSMPLLCYTCQKSGSDKEQLNNQAQNVVTQFNNKNATSDLIIAQVAFKGAVEIVCELIKADKIVTPESIKEGLRVYTEQGVKCIKSQ